MISFHSSIAPLVSNTKTGCHHFSCFNKFSLIGRVAHHLDIYTCCPEYRKQLALILMIPCCWASSKVDTMNYKNLMCTDLHPVDQLTPPSKQLKWLKIKKQKYTGCLKKDAPLCLYILILIWKYFIFKKPFIKKRTSITSQWVPTQTWKLKIDKVRCSQSLNFKIKTNKINEKSLLNTNESILPKKPFLTLIIWSRVDFEKYTGFPVWNTLTSKQNGIDVFKCENNELNVMKKPY